MQRGFVLAYTCLTDRTYPTVEGNPLILLYKKAPGQMRINMVLFLEVVGKNIDIAQNGLQGF